MNPLLRRAVWALSAVLSAIKAHFEDAAADRRVQLAGTVNAAG
jgi:hypothetical protein